MDADDGTEKDAEADTEDNQKEDTEVDAEDGTEEDAERNTEENREEDAENDAGVDAECGTEEDAKGDMEENQEECTWNTARKTWFGIFDESSATPIIIIFVLDRPYEAEGPIRGITRTRILSRECRLRGWRSYPVSYA